MTADISNFPLHGKTTPLHPDQFNQLGWGLAETAPEWGLGRQSLGQRSPELAAECRNGVPKPRRA
jgi:hypothetical protein